MRRRISILMAIIFIVNSISFTTISAVGSSKGTKTDYYILYSSDGEIISYNMPTESDKARAEDGTYLKSIRLSSGSLEKVDCGYHPQTQKFWNPAWYSFTKSRTVSLGFNFSIGSETYGATIEVAAMASEGDSISGYFPADYTRGSKVRVYVDFDYILYRGEVRDIYTDELYYTFNYTALNDTEDFFLVVFEDDGWP